MTKLMKTTKYGKEIYVGKIENGIYSRTVHNIHLYEYTTSQGSVKGWFVDRGVCQKYIYPDNYKDQDGNEKSIIYVQIYNMDENILYSVDRKTFMINAIELRDRFLLPLEYWEASENEEIFNDADSIHPKRD